MIATPTGLRIVGDRELLIEWSDGMKRQYLFRELRDRCPCATCREKRAQAPEQRSLLPVITDAQAQPLKVLGMKPVGNYAYSIQFSDGHDTGIYSFELLRQLGREIQG